MTNHWGIVVGVGLVIILALSAGAIYSLRKRYAYDLQPKAGYESRPRCYITFFILSSAETKIYPAHKMLKCQQLLAF